MHMHVERSEQREERMFGATPHPGQLMTNEGVLGGQFRRLATGQPLPIPSFDAGRVKCFRTFWFSSSRADYVLADRIQGFTRLWVRTGGTTEPWLWQASIDCNFLRVRDDPVKFSRSD